MVWEFTKYLLEELHQHLCLSVSAVVLLGGHPHMFILHICSFRSILLSVHKALYTLLYVYNLHILGTYERVVMIPRKQYLCKNKRCVAMSKAFLCWLMWCLSKHFSLQRDDSSWDNTSESPSTHKGILLSLTGWGNNGWRWERGKGSAGWSPDDQEWTGCDFTKLVLF